MRVADEERISALEQHARFVGEEIRKISNIRQTARQIYPRQIGRLRNVHDCFRKLPSQKRLDKREVLVEILLECLMPRTTVRIGRLRRCQRHGVDHAEQLVALLIARTQRGIADDDVGKCQPRHVKGLGRRHAGDELGIAIHDLCHRDVAAAAADQVTVDLVGHHPEVILFDDRSDSAQLILRPHTAGGVVRVAPEYQLTCRIGALALEVLIIHLECAVSLLVQRRSQHIYTCILRRVEKIAVGRRVEQHLFARCAKHFRQLIQCRNNAR